MTGASPQSSAATPRAPGAAPRVSGVVICMNEIEHIERCLRSLSFCDEIVVVDSGSTDGTRELAARLATRVIDQEFLGYVKQKNFALERASGEWVVCLDADEALSPELAARIPRAIAAAPPQVSGFRLERITHFLGVWHDAGEWYPDPQLRVFRRECGHWTGRDPHDRIELKGEVQELPGQLLHWNYRDLSEHIRTVDRFSARQAQGMLEEGKRFSLRELLLHPPFRFAKGYFARGGFRKGVPGLLVSVSTAYYVFMKYAKLWELEQRARAGVDGTAPRSGPAPAGCASAAGALAQASSAAGAGQGAPASRTAP